MIKFRADCPMCGAKLIKGAPSSDIEVDCPKCHRTFMVKFDEDGIHVRLTQNDISHSRNDESTLKTANRV